MDSLKIKAAGMKSNSYRFIILLFIIIMSVGHEVKGQPMPGDTSLEAANGNPVGGGAPVGSGLLILMGLGGAYAGKKYYDLIS